MYVCLSWAEWNGKNADVHSLKCQLLEGFITQRKVAESSTQLSCQGESYSKILQNECPLKVLAVVAFDLPKLSHKIAYPEWNRMEKKLMVTV